MLVPSIETASSDALIESPRLDRQHEAYSSQQESYPRRIVERRRQSPAPSQVIVINDDSPQLKRRRVVYEDDAGPFRPVASRDHDLYSSAPRAESRYVRREITSSQPGQGMFRHANPSFTGPLVGERVPIYDAPPDTGCYTPPPERYRPVEVSHGTIQREGPPIKRQMESQQPYLENGGERSYTRQLITGDMRVIEHDRERQIQPDLRSKDPVQRPSPPAFPVSRISRHREMDPEPVAYQSFLDNFSQARLDPPLPRARDGFTIIAERSHRNSLAHDNNSRRHEYRPAESFTPVESFTTLRRAEARSPVRYVERPV